MNNVSRVSLNSDNVILCYCQQTSESESNLAQLKYARKGREPFIACHKFYASKKSRCSLKISLKDLSTVSTLNNARGISLLTNYLIMIAKIMVTAKHFIEFDCLNYEDIKSFATAIACQKRRRSYEVQVQNK